MKKIAIFGSGPCGLSMLIALKYLEAKGEDLPEIVCFEKQDDQSIQIYTKLHFGDGYVRAIQGRKCYTFLQMCWS